MGEGDCHTDLDCKGDLVCGVNNCANEFPRKGTIWNWYDDCCTGKTNYLSSNKKNKFPLNVLQEQNISFDLIFAYILLY